VERIMDERGAVPEPPRSRWVRRTVLLGSIGAGLWLAGSLGHATAAQAAVANPPACCPVQAISPPDVRTIVPHSLHTLLDPTSTDPRSPAVVGTLTHRPVLPARALPDQVLPVRVPLVRALPGSTTDRVAAPAPGRSAGLAAPARLNTTAQRSIVPARCATCRPDKGDQRSAPHPTPAPALPGGPPSDGGNAASSVAAMALLAPANGHSDRPPGLRSGSAYRLPAPRSRTSPPTTRPG
jgi:hypothetical protein